MYAMATVAYRVIDREIVVLVGTTGQPDAATWDAYCNAVATLPTETPRVVIFTDGGRPTREQLARIEEAVGHRYSRTVLVTPSVAARIIGSMINAVSKKMNGGFYSPDEIIEALASLGITDSDQLGRILSAATQLAHDLIPSGHVAALGMTPRHHGANATALSAR